MVRAVALALMLVANACAASVAPSTDAGADAFVQESGMDVAAHEASVDVHVGDIAPELGSDAATTPCSDLRCNPGEICVHQGFVEDGGFRECDRACLPAPSASPGTCETGGSDYCRLACFAVIDGAIYCLCE